MLSVLDIIEDTMVDGPGFRTSIYCAGCHHACPGCQNPQSWDINNGRLMSTREIMDIIKSDPWANVTFSGGDPMYQAEGFTELARAIRQETDKDIWCFTGYTYEQIVDGPFIQTLRNPDLLFRGSSNQRLINVQASLKNQRIVLLNEENLLF